MSLTMLDWRRRITAAYADVRASRGVDDEGAWHRWRAARDDLFARHPDTPIDEPSGFRGLHYAAYDESLRFEAPVTDAEPLALEVQTSDGVVPLRRIGTAQLPMGSLDVWWIATYGGGVFVPFADASNGHTTYGGGRYLIDTIKGADLGSGQASLWLDFNYAYHPSCFYSARWSCPLAQPGNRLATEINAGELAQPVSATPAPTTA
ncbi:MAG: DUF1684 domain-containing protein [Actinomycetota bacterium]